MVFFNYFEFF